MTMKNFVTSKLVVELETQRLKIKQEMKYKLKYVEDERNSLHK